MPTVYELETLATYFVGEVKDLKDKLKEAERAFGQIERTANKSSDEVNKSVTAMGRTALTVGAGILGLGTALDAAFSGVKLAAEAEQVEASFTVLLGSVEQAHKSLKELRDFALETPFQLPEILDSAKQMTAFGEEADNLIPTMRLLGEVSSGLQIPLKELAYLYGTLKAQGRAFTVDIRQFAARGIPIYLELAKTLGLVGAEAKRLPKDIYARLDKMIEQGTVDFEVVEAAFKRMTGPGGTFFGQLEAQSKTVVGLFNQMKEEVDTALKAIGQTIIESLNLKDVIRQIAATSQEVNTFLKNLTPQTKEAIKIVMVLTTTFIALAAAVAIAGVVFNLLFGGLGVWIGLATVAVAGTTAWAMSVGGLEKAWKRLKRAVQDLWDFVEPVLPALAAGVLLVTGPLGLVVAGVALLVAYWDDITEAVGGFWQESQPILRAAWDLVKVIGFTLRFWVVQGIQATVEGFKNLRQWLKHLAFDVEEIYNSLNDGQKRFLQGFAILAAPFKIAFDRIKKLVPTSKEELRDLMFFAEYVWRNFGRYVNNAILKAGQYFHNFVGDITHFFKSTVPIALGWFLDNWRVVFGVAFNIGKAMIENLVTLIRNGLENLPDIIAGKVDMGKLAADQMKIFNAEVAREMKKLPPGPDFPKREADLILETELLDLGFDAFKRKKLELWEREDVYNAGFELGEILADAMKGVEPQAAEAGNLAGGAFAKEFGKAAGKWDAVLFDSAEARFRIQAYRELFAEVNRPPRLPPIPAPLLQAPLPREVPQLPVAPLPREVPQLPVAPPPRGVGPQIGGAPMNPRAPDFAQTGNQQTPQMAAVIGLLIQIAANTLEEAKKPTVLTGPAGMED